ncbi:hypothetical protein P280DRAFT_467473 [Massarina eburnea CBS 473.64]|uniref:Anaphase-promoting complex subunit 5 n=1 Tax=Massarina eburnea CBS 473.64 TaxID=1395130 RepID=A0A6A6SBA3_9PLEO|nr:hypothetical protein P280DRAFT_467473 [Massarina eburnea CBS 473.64]
MSKPRYLTASKISLLVLVNLYCSDGVPSSATIPVLSFILSHSFPTTHSAARAPRSAKQHDVAFSIRAFEDVLKGHASSMPGRSLLDVFLKDMWGMNSFDALFILFDRLGDLLARPREEASQDDVAGRVYLSQTSPLGALIRRARVEFVRLPFDDAIRLWSAFIAYRAPTAKWNKRLAGLASSGVDIVAAGMGLQPGDDLYETAYGRRSTEEVEEHALSLDDLERLLEFQLDRLQRLGCRVPDEMKDPLRDMLESCGTAPRQAHLVQFFDTWKAGDYTSAFDNLHRYFDYAMQARERIHYQYALLHMAILQADFGCFGEAIAAINETIATARENQDIHCLNFSLNWLHHMSKAYPKQMKRAGYIGMLGSEKEGLAFLKAKARETKTYNLLSATLLNEAKLCLLMGDPVSRAFEHLYQSAHLNLKEDIGNHSSHMLFQSALSSRLGITYLSGVYCELLLHCYHHSCPLDDHIRATGRLTFLALQKGRYNDALALLSSISTSTNQSLKFHQYIFFCTGLSKLKRAIHWTDWTTCTALLSSLQPDASTDPELSFLLSESRIDYLVMRGLYSEAFTALEALSESLKEEGADVMQRISVLIAKAELFRRAGEAERGFSVALRAASVAFKARLMPCLWSAIGMLANILNSVAEYEAAMRLLHAIVPQSLENVDHFVTGKLYSHLGDSYIGRAGMEDTSTSRGARLRALHVSRAETYIDRARECFKRVEDLHGECEQLVKKAIVAKLRGDETLAEEWAQKHNRVWDQATARFPDSSTNC